MSPPLRIAHIIVRLETGGAERSLLRLVSEAKSHFDQTQEHVVVCFGDNTPVAEEIRKAGIPLHLFKLNPVGLWQVMRLLRALNPTHLQGWMYYGNLLASLLSIGCPLAGGVLWNVRNENRGFPARVRWTIWLSQFFSPNMVIYNSSAGLNSHKRFTNMPSIQINNGIATERYSPNAIVRATFRASVGLAEDEVAVALVGRYHPVKGVQEFLEVMQRIDHPKVRFLLIGTGMEASNKTLTRLIDEVGGGDIKLTLLGEQRNLPQVYPGLDLVVVASYREGTPNVLLEAMSSGVTVVGTDVGDVASIVADEQRICPPQDVAALAEVISHALSHLGEFAERDRQRILDRYDSGRCQLAYQQLYHQLAESKD